MSEPELREKMLIGYAKFLEKPTFLFQNIVAAIADYFLVLSSTGRDSSWVRL